MTGPEFCRTDKCRKAHELSAVVRAADGLVAARQISRKRRMPTALPSARFTVPRPSSISAL
jgi:hypothetical protein